MHTELAVRDLEYCGHTIRGMEIDGEAFLVVPDVEAAIPTTDLWNKAQKKLRERERLLQKSFTRTVTVGSEQLQVIHLINIVYVLGQSKKEQAFEDWRQTALIALWGIKPPVEVELSPEQLAEIEGPEDQNFDYRREWIEHRLETNVLNTLHPFHHLTAMTRVVVDRDETLEDMLNTLPEGEREGLVETWSKRISPHAYRTEPVDREFYVRLFQRLNDEESA